MSFYSLPDESEISARDNASGVGDGYSISDNAGDSRSMVAGTDKGANMQRSTSSTPESLNSQKSFKDVYEYGPLSHGSHILLEKRRELLGGLADSDEEYRIIKGRAKLLIKMLQYSNGECGTDCSEPDAESVPKKEKKEFKYGQKDAIMRVYIPMGK
ncbi:hypothetical protein H4219_004340 [Mycoemilia scoparia]|uniref:Uncharacterized protein n=1 Tax=Mycoemilia scoparia TaxID=417184 RepID=A0A9W7ZSM1_9FUNG|nr:hypothetical protein H4219_004340 [Mycoemilia scoparia]